MSAYNQKYNPQHYEYRKREFKRVPLDVKTEDYKRIKAAADAAGLPVNTWIKSVLFSALDASGAPAPAGDGSTVGGSGDSSGAG